VKPRYSHADACHVLPTAYSYTYPRSHLVEEVDAEHVRAGRVHLLEAEQVGRDARAQAGLCAEGREEDLLVVDPAADAPVGGELAW
jgi:hypothetical protein